MTEEHTDNSGRRELLTKLAFASLLSATMVGKPAEAGNHLARGPIEYPPLR